MIRSFRLSLALACAALALLTGCGGGGGGSTPAPPIQTPSVQTPPSGPAVVITNASLKPGILSQSYSQQMTAAGGSGKYTWRVTGLPSGVNIDPNSGVIAGTPSQFGQGVVVVSATDTADARNNTSHAFLMFVSQGLSVGNAFNSAHLNAQYSSALPVFGEFNSVSITAGALPPGLQLTQDFFARTYSINGTPTLTGTFPFTLQVTGSDQSAQVLTQQFSITVDSAFPIAQARADDGIQGKPYSFTFSAVNGKPPYVWSAPVVPLGMTFDAATATVTGTPLASQNSLLLNVTDSSSPPQTASLSSPINLAPQLTVPASVHLSVNRNVQVGFAFGGAFPVRGAVVGGQLPPGIQFDISIPNLEGRTSSLGSHPVVLRVADSSVPPQVVEGTVDIVVDPAPLASVEGSQTFTKGTAVSHKLPLSGGSAPFTWRVTAGALPPGLVLDSATGVISGTPSQEGSFPFTYSVHDSSSPVQRASSAAVALVIAPHGRNDTIANATPLGSGVFSASLSAYTDSGGADQDYYRLLAPSGSIVGLTVASTSGAIRPVLEFVDGNGSRLNTCSSTSVQPPLTDTCLSSADPAAPTSQAQLSIQTGGAPGTPFTFYAHVLDWHGIARPDLTYSMFVQGAVEPLRFTGFPLDRLIAGKPIDATFTTGGFAPITLTLTSGTLPDGLSISANGHLTGTPTTPGSTTVAFQATDSSNPPQRASGSVAITILNPVKIDPAVLPDGKVGVPYTFQWTGTGGFNGNFFTWSWQLPPELTIVSLNDIGTFTGKLTVTPTAPGTFNIQVTALDVNTASSDTKTFPVTIAP